ncbi:MAG: hypothetical protein OEY59_10615, partial [Deltaproteobacteria bacterium]|nr:hypothetical protein [Deltaproteobacteria bacterium]
RINTAFFDVLIFSPFSRPASRGFEIFSFKFNGIKGKLDLSELKGRARILAEIGWLCPRVNNMDHN